MLEFKEPRGGYHRRRQVNDIAMELRSYPNRSAIVRTYPIDRQQNAHTYAYHINAGRHQAFTGCTASAVTENGVVNVYAMYPRFDDVERMSDAVCFDTVRVVHVAPCIRGDRCDDVGCDHECTCPPISDVEGN